MVLLAEVVWVSPLHLWMEMTGVTVCRRIEQRRRRQSRLAGIVGSVMHLIVVKPRNFLVVRQEIVRLRRWVMQRPVVVLEILALQRVPPRLLQPQMLLAQLLQLLSAELLRVVVGRGRESDRRVRGQMRMRRVQRR